MNILNAFLTGLCSFFACASVFSVLFLIFELKESGWKQTVFFSAVGALISALGGVSTFLSDKDIAILWLLTLLLPVIIAFSVFKSRSDIIKIPCVSAILFCTAKGITGIIGYVMNIDAEVEFRFATENASGLLVWGAVFIILIAARKQNSLPLIRNVCGIVPKWLIPVWSVLNLNFYFVTFGGDGAYINGIVRNLLFSVSAVCVFICVIYFCWKLFSLSFQQSQILRQLDEQHTNYESMLMSDQQLRHFRHDYKNHMLVVTALLDAGKAEEASEYLETIKAESGVQSRQISTGNFVADAILNSKNALARDLDIKLNFSGTIPGRGIASSDLCTVIGNLVDNAIEGNKRFNGDKYINIETASRSPFFVLTVENPVNERVQIKNNRIRTTKSDSKNHGIGLKNVGRIAEKYNGRFRIDCDDEKFSADISFKINDDLK